jgi:hypothetical protein
VISGWEPVAPPLIDVPFVVGANGGMGKSGLSASEDTGREGRERALDLMDPAENVPLRITQRSYFNVLVVATPTSTYASMRERQSTPPGAIPSAAILLPKPI